MNQHSAGGESGARRFIPEFFDEAYSQTQRYWLHSNRNSVAAPDFSGPWAMLLDVLAAHRPGTALDLGAGEGSDAIRLARLGFRVDAVEASSVGARRIEQFAREASVAVNVIQADVRAFRPRQLYDVILCNGLLHYVPDDDKRLVLKAMQESTAGFGFNMVLVFADYTPVPACHQVVDVYPDQEEGIVAEMYRGWRHAVVLERNKLDTSHADMPPHRHSFLKLLAQNTPPDTPGGSVGFLGMPQLARD